MPADIVDSTSIPGVYCQDYVYNGGELNFTEDCSREIGRGSALVESGSCKFYGFENDGCEGTPYLTLEEGVCDEQIQISNFTCVSCISFSVRSLVCGSLDQQHCTFGVLGLTFY